MKFNPCIIMLSLFMFIFLASCKNDVRTSAGSDTQQEDSGEEVFEASQDSDSDPVEPDSTDDPDTDLIEPDSAVDPDTDMVEPDSASDPDSDPVEPDSADDPDLDQIEPDLTDPPTDTDEPEHEVSEIVNPPCEYPVYSDDCSEVGYFQCGYEAGCSENTIYVSWHEHYFCDDVEEILAFTCSYGCESCEDGPIIEWVEDGTELIDKYCLDDECLPEEACILDHTCATRNPEFPVCFGGVCMAEKESEWQPAECAHDTDCPMEYVCTDRYCIIPECNDDDCECGEFAFCRHAICEPCTLECSDSESCTQWLQCEYYGYNNSCSKCTGCPSGAPPNDQVTSAVISTDPERYVNQEITVVGNLFTSRTVDCDDEGPCGTCYPGLTLDGVLSLRGSEGPGRTLCGRQMGCTEREDSCLPQWDCTPFAMGARVRILGVLIDLGGDFDDPWREVTNRYVLEVHGIEEIAGVSSSGLYTGTAYTQSITGDGCGTFPNSSPIELVVVQNSFGLAMEFMAPGFGQLPLGSGWHTGTTGHDGLSFTVEHSFLGRFTGALAPDTISGTYEFSLSGVDCQVSSVIYVGRWP